MDKREQLVDMVSSGVIDIMIEETHISIQETMQKFYNSECFKKLEDLETGLYRESPAYVYDLYQIEQKYGKLVQLEE
ncbi:MAG: hypothetical protein LBM77_05890 [Spirochaetaceae bacterium]|jgi:hypothetical protein|nr:hypothetical protein [Spirochaetaceae bacterium]